MRLIGRDRELEALRGAIGRARIVSVWGPAGVGKTRLCVEAVGRDATFCRLRGVTQPAELWRAVASAIGIEPGGPALEHAIARALARQQRPVIFDGADAVLEPLHAALTAWTATAAGPCVVVTATQPLPLDGVEAIGIEPLTIDDAIALWQACSDRDVGSRAIVAAIVNQLDRLPLAIEWFVVRAGLVGEAAALEQLRRFAEGSDPLASAIEAALDTLDPSAYAAAEWLCTFEAGVTPPLLAANALAQIDVLRQRSLLRVGVGVTASRFAVKALRRRAHEAGRWPALARQHADAVLALAETNDDARLEPELLAIVDRFEHDAPALAARAAIAVVPGVLADGTAARMLAIVERLLASRDPELPADALRIALARLALRLGRHELAQLALDDALQRDGPHAFEARIQRAHLHRTQSRLPEALAGYEAALQHARDRGDPALEAVALGETGRMLQSLGRPREAQARHREAIALQRALGLRQREALELSLHARATHRAGDVRAAVPLHEHALALHRELGDARLLAAEHGHLGFCLHELGELERAREQFTISIEGLAAVGDVVLECIERILLARLLADTGDHERARLELAIASATTTAISLPRVEQTRLFVAGLVEAAALDLPAASERFAAALERGLMFEVGFEALLPAYAAVGFAARGEGERAQQMLAQSEATVARLDNAGLLAALRLLEAAASQRSLPDVPPELAAISSDVRRALRFVALVGVQPGLAVSADGRRMRLPDGTTHDLGRRAAPRRVLLALAEARRDHPGTPLPADALIAAGWPGEKMRDDAARKRLRTAIWTLRGLGLEPMLQTRDEGYLLDPGTPIRVEPEV